MISLGSSKPRPPAAAQRRPLPLRLASATSVDLASPSHTDSLSRQSTDVQSIISLMLDTSSSKQPKTLIRQQEQASSSLTQDGPSSFDAPLYSSDVVASTMAEKRGTMDSLVSKYIVERKGSEDGQKWLNWQREAEAELEKSRMAWADTAASRAALESESIDRLSTSRFFSN